MFWNKEKKEENNGMQGSDLTIVNYLTDGLLVFDKNNRLFLLNPQAKKILDVEDKDVLGKSTLEINRFERMEPLVKHLGAGLRECFREEV